MLSNRRDHIAIDIPPPLQEYEITIKNVTFMGCHLIPKILNFFTNLTGQTTFDISIRDLKNENI